MTAVKKQTKFLGFDTAQELKDFLVAKHGKAIGTGTPALVYDMSAPAIASLHLLVRRKGTSDALFLILPDSKDLAVARARMLRTDIPFIFEVLA